MSDIMLQNLEKLETELKKLTPQELLTLFEDHEVDGEEYYAFLERIVIKRETYHETNFCYEYSPSVNKIDTSENYAIAA